MAVFQKRRAFDVGYMTRKEAICILSFFSRENLRDIARSCGIPIGRNKLDTIKNIYLYSDKVPFIVDIKIINPCPKPVTIGGNYE